MVGVTLGVADVIVLGGASVGVMLVWGVGPPVGRGVSAAVIEKITKQLATMPVERTEIVAFQFPALKSELAKNWKVNCPDEFVNMPDVRTKSKGSYTRIVNQV